MTVTALSLALLAPVPALAQEASPSTTCPNVSYVAGEEDREGPADTPVTIEGGSDVQPAMTPDRWTLTRVSPGPVEVVDSVEASATFSFTVTVPETTTFRIDAVGPEGCDGASATFTRTVTGDGGPDYCRDPETGQGYQREARTLTASRRTITAGERVTVALAIPGPYNRVEAYIHGYQWVTPTRQGGYDVLSSSGNGSGPFAPGESATRTVTIAPTNNTKVMWAGAIYCGPTSFHGDVFSADPTIIDVAPRLTLTAVRNGVRDYTFSGVATTPGLILNLYRVNADGSRVLTSQARATEDRTWTIHRKFLGAGRFGFVVLTGRTMANAPGASNLRDTVIH